MQLNLKNAARFHRDQAYQVADRFLEAKDPVTGLVPLHVKTENGHLVAADHVASGLDMGRTTAGLVMTAEVARAEGDADRADRYTAAAEENWKRGQELLAEGDAFVHLRDFQDDGSTKSTLRGEPGKSAQGQDNMARVNPRGYAFRGAADLYRATGKEEYKAEFDRYFQGWVRDFHDDRNGGFFLHGNLDDAADHSERSSFNAPGGEASKYDGSLGAKGNDGTIYALSGVLLPANETLHTLQTQELVKEQMDTILHDYKRQNGMLWENYTADLQPVSQDWQNQQRSGNAGSSHVAIGGHTAMAAQQILEGAHQLKDQGAIDPTQFQGYVDGTVQLFQDFAANSGAIDWNTGAVHNAIRVEEPEQGKRWISEWGDASWQQAELLQSLLRLQQEGRLADVQGPNGKTGEDLLASAEQYYADHYGLKQDYAFSEFGNPDVYHIPQAALYFQQARDKRPGA